MKYFLCVVVIALALGAISPRTSLALQPDELLLIVNPNVPAGVRTADDPPALTRAQVEEGIWQRTLIRYLARHPAISFMYWSLTPDSSDTGGLLNDDWQTANSTKEVLLTGIQGAALPLHLGHQRRQVERQLQRAAAGVTDEFHLAVGRDARAHKGAE